MVQMGREAERTRRETRLLRCGAPERGMGRGCTDLASIHLQESSFEARISLWIGLIPVCTHADEAKHESLPNTMCGS